MKIKVHYDQKLAHDELQIAAFEPSRTLDYIIDFAQKELFYLIGLKEKEKVRIDLKDIQRIYSANKQVFCMVNGQEYQLLERLYQLQEKLPNSFVQISRIEMIQIQAVNKLAITRSGIIEIIFKDRQKTSASRRYLKKVKEVLEHA
ncbi:LytTR family transcriptional regulator [Enterococcus cecorum]|uniref:LytTR family DNA-binding domain-containing protein n=1 Tax=Enterococcus cecorum TaxID=44008 RepID=UPI00148C4C32|nr:LytTR family DNA-binding domain-containing protein [Enterococcus cecorum]MCJ0543596.1 LytTR family transcriptional regulator [Enterococcus cecorum]MCJ0547866.1 LytTR family transcriptional regulator [Enterococcus cecorum]MCJ0554200.1 LytTR family transcriptional regulator [Enterococcus cecorum]MCJ0557677.1 LytTR family transcriptional regulator [Enterococcus cecorum]MCJ0562426.1 LytTR family transcriptional regulator [Enterococcus cecorum]